MLPVGCICCRIDDDGFVFISMYPGKRNGALPQQGTLIFVEYRPVNGLDLDHIH